MSLIVGVNDDRQNLQQLATFVARLPSPQPKVSLLPFHNVAANKYRNLGQWYDAVGMGTPDSEQLHQAAAILAEHGLGVSIGG